MKKSEWKIKKKLLAYALIIVSGVIGYYGIELIIAYQKKDVLRKQYLSPDAVEITSRDLSSEQLKALIRVQDPNFYGHQGVDFSTPGNGWTTITQSIVKWLYFKEFKQGIRKIKQTLIARLIANYHFAKDEQLTIFINNIWFEPDVVGLQQAAKHFFHKTICQVTQDEYLALVAMMINPQKYNIHTAPKENKKRVERIKRYLRDEYRPKGLFDIEYDKFY